MKSLLIGFGVALAAAGGATFLVLQAQPIVITPAMTTPTESVPTTQPTDCTEGCPTCTIGSTVYDVADLQSIYTKPAGNVEMISFEEPPLAQKREVLPAPREVR
jgi:hypothetical protein